MSATQVASGVDTAILLEAGTNEAEVLLFRLRAKRFGVNVARRGWLQKGDLLNTRTARQLRKELGKD